MRRLLVSLTFVFLALPHTTAAATITWFASGEITNVSDPFNIWPGLTTGTPWTLTFDVDPDAAPLSTSIGGIAGCNGYATGSATFTLGGFTYTSSGGTAFTNHNPTDVGCTNGIASEPDGLISFAFDDWTQEPGAWNLNVEPAILVAAYYDLLATDGRLPVTPAINPMSGLFDGLEHEGLAKNIGFFSPFVPTTLNAAPVPEPATLTMLGIGLAAVAARRRRRDD